MNNKYNLKALRESCLIDGKQLFEVEFSNAYKCTLSEEFLEQFYKDELFIYYKQQAQKNR